MHFFIGLALGFFLGSFIWLFAAAYLQSRRHRSGLKKDATKLDLQEHRAS
jgi:hypothetical protein